MQHDGFNPTLVRFCRGDAGRRNADSGTFQSHLGSILPCGAMKELNDFIKFQSHLGSILPPKCDVDGKWGLWVSIPPWFDFAILRASSVISSALVSIPPWFDFADDDISCVRGKLQVSIPPWFDFA